MSRPVAVEIHGLLNEGDSADLLLPGKWHEPPVAWKTMLQVEIASGYIAVNYLGEVMGEMFGTYSQDSAYGDQRVRLPGYDSSITLSRRRVSRRTGKGGKRR